MRTPRAAELVSRRTGVICAAFAACNPFLIWYSQEARSYESLVLLTGLALLAFARARRDPTPVALGLWVVAAALSMATHYFAVLAIVPQAVLLLATHPRRRAVQLGVGVAALCGLGLIPLAISQNGAGNDAWIATEPLRLRLAQIIPQFLIGTGAPVRQGFKYAAFALVVAASVLLAVRFRRSSAFERAGVLVALGLAVGGFALALLLIVAGSDVLITRNLIELWLPAAIVVAAGCSAASGVAARVGGAIAGGTVRDRTRRRDRGGRHAVAAAPRLARGGADPRIRAGARAVARDPDPALPDAAAVAAVPATARTAALRRPRSPSSTWSRCTPLASRCAGGAPSAT